MKQRKKRELTQEEEFRCPHNFNLKEKKDYLVELHICIYFYKIYKSWEVSTEWEQIYYVF